MRVAAYLAVLIAPIFFKFYEAGIVSDPSVIMWLYAVLIFVWSAIAVREVRTTPYVVYAAIFAPLTAVSLLLFNYNLIDGMMLGLANFLALIFLNVLFVDRSRQVMDVIPVAKLQMIIGVIGLITAVLGVLYFIAPVNEGFLATYNENMLIGYLESIVIMGLCYFFMRKTRREAILPFDRFMVTTVFYTTAGSILGMGLLLWMSGSY